MGRWGSRSRAGTFAGRVQVVPAELADAFPEGTPVDFQIAPHGGDVVDGIGDHHLATAAGILVDAVQVAPEGVAQPASCRAMAAAVSATESRG